MPKILSIIVLLVVAIVGLVFIVVGVRDGLLAQRMLRNAWRGEYVTGGAAIRLGLFYILIGVLEVGLIVLALFHSSRS
jgi:hypothetical protein